MSGRGYDAIAKELGYANRGTAFNTVQRALKEREASAVDEFRATEMARLDRLQQSVWANAVRGNVRAVGSVVAISNQRLRVMGLS